MDELVEKLTAQLGIDASVAHSATGKAMALVKDNVSPELFQQISGAIPGLDNATSAAQEQTESSGGGLLGSVAGLASNMLGGSAGDAIELGASLKSAGLDTDQMGSFANTVIDFIRSKVGDDVANQLLEKVPMLKSLMG